MSDIHPAGMLEATRLTRAGRLTEATALLQRTLKGEAALATMSGVPDGAARQPAAPAARIIDVVPEKVEVADRQPSSRTTQPPRAQATTRPTGGREGTLEAYLPEALQGFLERVGRIGHASGPGRGATPSPAAEVMPEGARFLALSFANQAGSRAYKLYVPSGYHGQRLPLVVMLHGCTQSPDDFAVGTRMNALAEEHPCLVAYPAQAATANQSRCWNWFSPGDQERDRGEPSLIAGITLEIMRAYAVDPRRVYVAGLSAGGAAAAVMAATYPDLYAAVGVHSGLACGTARDLPSAFAAMRQGGAEPGCQPGGRTAGRLVPTIVFHGDQDRTVHPRNGDQVIAQMRAAASKDLQATATVQRGQAPSGRAFSRTLHADASGRAMLEQWVVHGAGHAWSGGSPDGSYTDPQGPDASREMLRFFLEQAKPD